MKRALSMLFSLFVLAGYLAPLPAHAGWKQDPIGWQISSTGSPYDATSIYVRDTVRTRLNGVVTSNGGALDTTGIFSPTYATPVKVGPALSVASRGDSIVVGFLVFQLDTTSATAGAMSSLQVAIEGRAGGFGTNVNVANWTTLDTVSVAVANGAATVTVPVRPFGAFTGNVGQATWAFEQLRARTVAGVGQLFSARAFWRYWVPDVINSSGR